MEGYIFLTVTILLLMCSGSGIFWIWILQWADLQPLELLLLGPVVEGGDKDDHEDGQEDGQTLDPLCMVHALWQKNRNYVKRTTRTASRMDRTSSHSAWLTLSNKRRTITCVDDHNDGQEDGQTLDPRRVIHTLWQKNIKLCEDDHEDGQQDGQNLDPLHVVHAL